MIIFLCSDCVFLQGEQMAFFPSNLELIQIDNYKDRLLMCLFIPFVGSGKEIL